MIGPQGTVGGRAFQSFMALAVRVFLLTLEWARGFSSFMVCPRVLAVGAGVKNLSGQTSMPPLKIWYIVIISPLLLLQ